MSGKLSTTKFPLFFPLILPVDDDAVCEAVNEASPDRAGSEAFCVGVFDLFSDRTVSNRFSSKSSFSSLNEYYQNESESIGIQVIVLVLLVNYANHAE